VTPLFASASIYWDLPVLLVAFSLVYSATRHDRWDRILREAVGWGVRVGGFLVIVGFALYVFSSHPDYWPYLLGAAILLATAYTAVSTMLHRRRPAATRG
jgi:hypothetical protein